jgi:solute carrier family 25 oxoglutarate transporter 11
MQLLGETPQVHGVSQLGIAKQIVASEGFAGLYRGLSAAMVRQATYTTLRLGFYDVIKHKVAPDGKESLPALVVSAAGAGAIGSFLSCPVEVCLVRMQADGRLPVDKRRGYTNVVNALFRVGREEGVLTYWRGATPTVSRAIVVSITQLATYDKFKSLLKQYASMHEGLALHFSASLLSGLVYSFVSLPLDTAKTRMQTQAPVNGQLLYKSTLQTLGLIFKNEGLGSLWKGFTAYFARGGGHTIFMFIFLEQYRKMATAYWAH